MNARSRKGNPTCRRIVGSNPLLLLRIDVPMKPMSGSNSLSANWNRSPLPPLRAGTLKRLCSTHQWAAPAALERRGSARVCELPALTAAKSPGSFGAGASQVWEPERQAGGGLGRATKHRGLDRSYCARCGRSRQCLVKKRSPSRLWGRPASAWHYGCCVFGGWRGVVSEPALSRGRAPTACVSATPLSIVPEVGPCSHSAIGKLS
jgi:hypothetical protein